MAARPTENFPVNVNNEDFVHKIVWKPPFAGAWKLNYAYAYNEISRKGFVRYENAAFKVLFGGPLPQVDNPRSTTEAALMALSCGIGLAASQGGDSLEIEGEEEPTLTCSSLILGHIPPTDERTRLLVSSCLQELADFRRVEFSYVGPDANEAVTLLARRAMETDDFWFYEDWVPDEIAAILDADVNGRYVPKGHSSDM